jgi:RNA polymerase sigma-70 factor (ECF subfamily)
MAGTATGTPRSESPDDETFRQLLEAHQRAIRTHCYRMLGSLEDAEDLTQETFLRAWRRLESFEGRGPVRAWLYRIATHACLDELDRRGRRLLPPMLGAPFSAFAPEQATVAETPWLEPFPDAWLEVADTAPGPEARYESRESIELAFVAALQLLAPRQRAVLILRDVLGWSAKDVSELLEMSIPAANSALQRARARTDASVHRSSARPPLETERALVERYVHAWEHADVDGLVSLLREDATLSMPPLVEWYSGIPAIGGFFQWATGPEGPGPFHYVTTRANGSPALGIYARGQAAYLQVLLIEGDHIAAMTSFMNPALFAHFNLPPTL